MLIEKQSQLGIDFLILSGVFVNFSVVSYHHMGVSKLPPKNNGASTMGPLRTGRDYSVLKTTIQ